MFASSRIRGLIGPALAVVVLALALPGCEEDLKPKITKFSATPRCDVLKTMAKAPGDTTLVNVMEVRFFARAAGGNEFSDPTGANSPLKWHWDFGDGTTASDVVGPIHRYTKSRVEPYRVILTVEDDDGDKDTATLDILVGEAYSELDILHIDIEPKPELLFAAVPGSVATDLSQTWGEQIRLSRMDMSFDGVLLTSCSISGLFEQYLWKWTIVDAAVPDTTRLIDVEPASLKFVPGFLRLGAELSVTETVTGINRVALASTLNPVGAKVSFTEARTTVPNAPDTLELVGYLLQGVRDYRLELEWADSAATLETVVFTPEIEAGFATTATVDPAGGRAEISLTSLSPDGYAGPEIALRIADLNFKTKDVVPGIYPVRIRVPSAARTGEPEEGASFTHQDGAIMLDSDCDADGIPDSFQAEFYAGAFDCNQNGIHDTCDIQNGDSDDSNGNGIPDECEG